MPTVDIVDLNNQKVGELALADEGICQNVLHLCQGLFQDKAFSVVNAAVAAYGKLASPAQADLLLDLLGTPDYNARAGTAILRILQREPKKCGVFVTPYLLWLTKMPDNPLLTFSPSGLFQYFARVPNVSPQLREEATKTIVRALAEARD
jgi:HEAT repeat protein